MIPRAGRALVTALAVAAALGSSLFLYTSNRVTDDAFITLRYAENLKDGHGFRFNPGGERVEGFSSPLHVLATAGALAAGVAPLEAVQGLSILGALLAAGFLAWWATGRFGLAWGAAAGLALALNPGLGHWSRGGLETTLFTALAVLAFAAAAESRWTLMGVAGGLTAVCRPEGVLYLAPLFAFAWWRCRAAGRPVRVLAVPLLWAAGPAALWLLFRILYFHDVLPNTYYAKLDGVRASQAARGWTYLKGLLRRSEITVPLLFAAAGLAGFVLPGNRRREEDSWIPLAWGMLAAAVVFVLVAGGDHFNHHRFLLPAAPLLIAAGAGAGRSLARRIRRPVPAGAAALLLGTVFLSQPLRIAAHDLRHPTWPLDRPVGLVEPFDDWTIPRFYLLGEELRRLLPPDAVIAVVPAGAVPYASGLTTVDMLGLNDREIGREKVPGMGTGRMGHEKGDGGVVLGRRPDVIMLNSRRSPVDGRMVEPDSVSLAYRPVREIWASPAFHRDYAPFLVRLGDGSTYTLYRRRPDKS